MCSQLDVSWLKNFRQDQQTVLNLDGSIIGHRE